MQQAALAAALLLAVFAMRAQASEPTSDPVAIRTFADLTSYQNISFERAAKSYLGSLEFKGCAEIVEGGLAQLAMLKLAQPGGKQRAIENKLSDLAVDGESPTVRFKAYLASTVFTNPNLFQSEQFGNFTTGDELFAALASRLQKETLATR